MDWQRAVDARPAAVKPACVCDVPGQMFVSTMHVDGAVVAVVQCMNCGGILGTGSDG